jgi:hypothetical protein
MDTTETSGAVESTYGVNSPYVDPIWLRQRSLELAVQAYPGVGPHTLCEHALVFETYLRDGQGG